MATDSSNISPTAFATGYFWYAHGMSHPAFKTRRGRMLHYMFRPFIHTTRLVGGFSMDALMLARHRGIDGVLARLIKEGGVQQVVEVAAGLSPRGWDFMRRYPDKLCYLETDLVDMAALKRRLLEDAGFLSERHRVVELDALSDEGSASIDQVLGTLDPTLGTAVITEGLLAYFDPETANAVWRRFAKALRRFPRGYYLSDIYMQSNYENAGAGLFRTVLSSFVRGRIHVHFDSVSQVPEIMHGAGFEQVQVHEAGSIPETQDIAHIAGADRVQILEARVKADSPRPAP